MFDMTTSRDFLWKLEADFDDFMKKPHSVRLAVNCALTAYHLYEWVWGDWLKTDYATWKSLGIRDKESFLAWIDQGLSLVQHDPGTGERNEALRRAVIHDGIRGLAAICVRRTGNRVG
jgi:hypothetical protein